MKSSNNFFLICVLLSALIISAHYLFKKFEKPHPDQTTALFDYQSALHKKNELSNTHDMTSCQNPVTDLTLNFNSEIILNNRFLEKKITEEQIQEAINYQIKYLFGYFNLNKNDFEKIYLDAKPTQITVLSKKESKYPYAFHYENLWNNPPENQYQSRFFDNETRLNEKAIQIKYVAKVFAKSCGQRKEKSIQLILPKDPYLAPWAVRKNEYVLSKYNHSEDFISPCSDSEMADIKQIKWYWYTWTPSNPNCLVQIKNNPFYLKATAQIQQINLVKQQEVLPETFFTNKNSYDFSIVMGVLKTKKLKETLDILKTNIDQNNILNLNSVLKLKYLGQNLPETTLPALAILLEQLKFLIHINDVRLDWSHNSSLVIHITGTLQSNRKINLHLFYGSTSLETVESQSYLEFINQAISSSDVITYTGHAGMGKNFSLKSWSEKTKIPFQQYQKNISVKPEQIYLLVSCYANSYFGEDLIQFRSNNNLKTTLIRSAAQDYIYFSVLGLINFFNQPDLNSVALKSFIEPVDYGKNILIDFYY